MIKSVEIENYKNFKHLKMENFKLINFFTGQNDTGKTNLLEALYINTGLCDPLIDQVSLPPEHAMLVSEFRKIKPNNDNLKTFFYQGNTANSISIRTEFEHATIPLTIQYHTYANYNDHMANLINQISRLRAKPQLHFFYNLSLYPKAMTLTYERETHNYERETHNFGLIHSDLEEIAQIYKENAAFIPIELSALNSFKALENLRLASKEKELIEILKYFNPDILDADTIRNAVYIQIKDENTPLEKSPKRLLNSFGWGFIKFFIMASILIDNRIKCLFIDEIESGLHYTKMQEFLKALFELAQKLQIQIFATTHNKEFLLNAINTMPNNETEVFKDIALFEFEKESASGFIRHSYSMLEKALYRGMEVRG